MLLRLYSRMQAALWSDEGATAVEYGIMVALIAAIIVTMVGLVGQKVLKAFTDVNTALTPPPAAP